MDSIERAAGPLRPFIIDLINGIAGTAVLDASRSVAKELMNLLNFAEMTAVAVFRETVLVANPDSIMSPAVRSEVPLAYFRDLYAA